MRSLLVLSAVLAATLGVTAAGAQGGSSKATAHAASTVKVSVGSTGLGKVLVENRGFTLYEFTKDPRDKNTCVKTSGCSETWPALSASGKVVAGPGVKASLLSTIKLPNGSRQVVYDGHPLYRYFFASSKGETNYVGVKEFGGTWYAINVHGAAVKP